MRALADLLVADGVIDQKGIDHVLEVQAVYGGSFDTNLIEAGVIDERSLQPYLERAYGVENRVDPWTWPTEEAIFVLDADQVARYGIVPMRLHLRALDVLLNDATNLSAIDEVGFITGCRVFVNVATELRVAVHMFHAYGIEVPVRLRALLAGEIDPRPAGLGVPSSRGTARKAYEAGEAPLEVDSGLGGSTETLEFHAEVDQRPTLPRVPDVQDAARASMPELPPVEIRPRASSEGPRRDPAPPRHTPARSYDEVREKLAQATHRDDIPGPVLDYLSSLFQRVVLFTARNQRLSGWDARGKRLSRRHVETMRFSLDRPSVFSRCLVTGTPFHGRLPQEPIEEDLAIKLGGGEWPEHALVMPVRVKKRPVALIYGEADSDERLAECLEPVAVLADLVAETLLDLIRSQKQKYSD